MRTPQVNASATFPLSHPVDDSDIAFTMRLDRGSYICGAMGQKSLSRQRIGTTVDPLINLPTLNYLLAGLQLCYQPGNQSKWADLLHHLDKERYPDSNVALTLKDLRYIIRDLIRPFGIVRGSERQGGQDEVGLSPATWPVNFVSNFVLDGHEANIINIWHSHEISAGDDLVLRLKPMPIPRGTDCYTLNHYYKMVSRQDFESYFQTTQMHLRCTHVWQLVPDIFDLGYAPENGSTAGQLHQDIVMPTRFPVPLDYVWQEMGYWHIGRSQVMFRKQTTDQYYNNDMANLLKINHLDMTFQPSWHKVPGEELTGPRSINGAGAPIPAFNILPGMRGDAGGAGGGAWAPQLRLEFPFERPPSAMPPPPGAAARPQLGVGVGAGAGAIIEGIRPRHTPYQAAPVAPPPPLPVAAPLPAPPAPLAPPTARLPAGRQAAAPDPPTTHAAAPSQADGGQGDCGMRDACDGGDVGVGADAEHRKTQLAAGFASMFRQRSEITPPEPTSVPPTPARGTAGRGGKKRVTTPENETGV